MSCSNEYAVGVVWRVESMVDHSEATSLDLPDASFAPHVGEESVSQEHSSGYARAYNMEGGASSYMRDMFIYQQKTTFSQINRQILQASFRRSDLIHVFKHCANPNKLCYSIVKS